MRCLGVSVRGWSMARIHTLKHSRSPFSQFRGSQTITKASVLRARTWVNDPLVACRQSLSCLSVIMSWREQSGIGQWPERCVSLCRVGAGAACPLYSLLSRMGRGYGVVEVVYYTSVPCLMSVWM